MKQLLLYYPIYNFIAEEFISRLNEIPVDEDIIVRVNSPGGSVFAGWGIIAALTERKGNVKIKVDGNASSMAFFLTLFFSDVEALDVTKLMVHRAIAWVDNEDDKKILDNINSDLRKHLEKKIDKAKFKEITGVTVKEIFENEKRRDIWLTAKEAEQVGLVSKITRLKPKEIDAMKESLIAFSDFEDLSRGREKDLSRGREKDLQGSKAEKEEEKQEIDINKKTEKMTVAELKEKHLELYQEIYGLGATSEKDRVQAWLAFSEIDAEAVKKGIDEDSLVTSKVIAEMTVKGMSATTLKDTEEESQEAIDTAKKEADAKIKTKEEKAYAEAEKEAFEAAGLKTEKTE